jgi:hypothetical protein
MQTPMLSSNYTCVVHPAEGGDGDETGVCVCSLEQKTARRKGRRFSVGMDVPMTRAWQLHLETEARRREENARKAPKTAGPLDAKARRKQRRIQAEKKAAERQARLLHMWLWVRRHPLSGEYVDVIRNPMMSQWHGGSEHARSMVGGRACGRMTVWCGADVQLVVQNDDGGMLRWGGAQPGSRDVWLAGQVEQIVAVPTAEDEWGLLQDCSLLVKVGELWVRGVQSTQPLHSPGSALTTRCVIGSGERGTHPALDMGAPTKGHP